MRTNKAGPRDPPGRSLDTDEDALQRRKRDIGQGLRRSHYAVLVAAMLVGGFAVAALWLSNEAEKRAREAERVTTRLWEFSSRAAQLERLTRMPGQRIKTLEIVAEASRVKPGRELRDEAMAALMLPDVGKKIAWNAESSFEVPACYDERLEYYILNNDRGRAIVGRVSDQATLMDQQGLGRGTPYAQFSPDGRFAGIAFFDGQMGIWDWRQSRLIARFSTISTNSGEAVFDFSPKGDKIWILTTARRLQEFSAETWLEDRTITTRHDARLFRLSPSGRFAALGCGRFLEVWDLSTGIQRSVVEMTNDIWCVAWQPGEERLAIGCWQGLYLWEIGSDRADTVENGDIAITHLFFNEDGSHLYVSGWNVLGEVWDMRSRCRALEGGFGWPRKISPDEKRLATYEEKVGFGVREFYAPCGLRCWQAPAALGRNGCGGDLDPHDRWVVVACMDGWLLREVESGKELARELQPIKAVSFTPDGLNVVAWTSRGLARWRLIPVENGAVRVDEPTVFPCEMPAERCYACFTADRRYTAIKQGNRVSVFSTEIPQRHVTVNLVRTNDNSLYLSPDGRWLVTGYHNQKGLDLYKPEDGTYVRRFAEGQFAGPAFSPVSGQLFTCTAGGYESWPLPEGTASMQKAWREPHLDEGFKCFAPDGRVALVKQGANKYQLYDLKNQKDFATLDFREPQSVFNYRWSHDGRRIFFFGTDGSATRADLGDLRHELAGLGLDWRDDNPSDGFAPASIAVGARDEKSSTFTNSLPSKTNSNQARWTLIVAVGLAITIGIGLYVFRYQRRLFAGYLDTEALAIQRQAELHRTQAALVHSEKMKALGTMAAGVAHDFNNLLSVIRMSNELIEEEVQPQGLMKENFQAIQQAVQRGRGIVNSMLGYARDDEQLREFTSADLFSDAAALLGKSFLGGLILRVEVAADTPTLVARKGRLEQMLFNLIVNAAEAMHGEGTLTLGARPRQTPGSCILPPRKAPRFVELEVSDTGPGIPPEVLSRIFDPFFTTKTKGSHQGSGLGLSMLYAMAREDGIGVGVDAAPRKGASFQLLIPISESKPNKGIG